MKKSRFLILVLVVSISLIGAGYAYWSDALNINSTVNTGEFDVEFTKVKVDLNDKGEKTADEYARKTTAEITDSNTVTIVIDNVYPGKEITYTLEATNTGSIPVVFDDAVVKFDGSVNNLKSVLLGKFGSFGSSYVSMNELEDRIESSLAGFRIDPDTTKEIKGVFYLPKDVDNDDDVELKKLTTSITLNWTQHNNPDRSGVVVPTED